ncbi:MAG: DMT family transporter [Dysgonamonadaceae bacterium]|jgi:drug/metabolite transporter (DMT)-like permease|nr:DMT family transporter [Dysgonamonadaceae bacterium]
MEDKNWKGHLALLVAYFIFGLNTPLSKYVLAHGEISALALTFYRFAGAALLFWMLSLWTKRETVPWRDILLLFLASLFGIFINQLSFVAGLSVTSPIDASVITTLGPVMTMILASVFLKEPITGKKITGVLIGAAGAFLLIFHGNAGRLNIHSLEGNLLCMLSCASFALYLTLFKKLIVRYRVVTLMKWMFLFATLCSLPFCWQDTVRVDYAALPAGIYLRIAYVVVMATFCSYFLIPVGQKFLRPTIVSMYNYLQPLVSSLVAVVLGMDAFGWVKSAATLLIFLGVYVVIQSKSRAQMEKMSSQDEC